MLKPVEITPQNVRSLFGDATIPERTQIVVVHSKAQIVSGKVTISQVIPEAGKMVIKIHSTSDTYTYPGDRFFLPYLSASRQRAASSIAVINPRPAECSVRS